VCTAKAENAADDLGVGWRPFVFDFSSSITNTITTILVWWWSL
jgi:hypothetical protein